jgi:ABC-type Fe3+ transport system substrate-binding protein
MTRYRKAIEALFGAAVVAAFASPSFAQQNAEWDKVVQAARKEGQVIVWAQASETGRRFWKDAFERDNPGIRVNLFQPSNTAERDTRILREWEAKVLKADVFVAGSAGMVARLKPAGILQPLRPFLRDEILDGKNWLGGAPVWVDREKQFVMIADLPAGAPAVVNESVDANAVKNWEDLLDPKWDGKIISLDPRQSGQAYAFTLFMNSSKDLGPDFVRRFFKGGRVVFTSDQRQIGEWVDSGRMLIGFAMREPETRSLLSVGSKVKPLPALMAGGVQQTITVGSDSAVGVANFDPLPNPNATRVYVNWIYSKSGQQAMVDATGLFSVRVDVDTSKLPERIRQKPGVKYTVANDENLAAADLTKAMRDNVSAALADK